MANLDILPEEHSQTAVSEHTIDSLKSFSYCLNFKNYGSRDQLLQKAYCGNKNTRFRAQLLDFDS